MNEYEIWMEGFTDQGMEGIPARASRLNRKHAPDTLWEGETFQDACVKALTELHFEMRHYRYDLNCYWGVGLFDNETDARKSYG